MKNDVYYREPGKRERSKGKKPVLMQGAEAIRVRKPISGFFQHPARFLMLTGFLYVIVYNPDRKPALIARILHGAPDLPEALKSS